ncbi:MAG: hypothetical protein Q8S73_35795 [Deltaproteobacteria bacterium]|nr:hypothetical protein [Myxococcales bacterium]MDP3219520.1 hypothetical protein [Deltaproteobacteria bacterium]
MLVGGVAIVVMVVPVAMVVMRNTPAVMIVVVPRLRVDRRVVVVVIVLVAMVMAVLVAVVVAMVVLVVVVVAMLVAVVMSVRVLRPRGARRSARPARASVEGLSRGRRRTRRTMGDRVLGHRPPMLPAGPS